jgi:DNA-binding NarL/FixJ family response regulator
MVLVIALPDLALQLSRVVPGARYVLHVEGDDGRELRHQVHLHQPEVVVLDWRMGGNAWRAIDEVPAIVSRTQSRPHVIAVLPWVSKKVERAAADAGCFDVLSPRSPGFERDLLSAVEAARLDHRQPENEARRLSRDDLH